MLDNMQKTVLSYGIEYARSLVTFRTSKLPAEVEPNCPQPCSGNAVKNSINIKNSINLKNNLVTRRPAAPLVMVHGGAGSGKSKVITSLYNIMTDIL